MWVSSDLGLPAGLSIRGRIRIAGSEAVVTILVPMAAVIFIATVWLVVAFVGLHIFVSDVDLWNGFFVALWMWLAVDSLARGRGAVEALARDAVVTLETVARSAA